jgi:small GTP-binding protein
MNSIKRTKFNVCVLGESRVGKTSMTEVFTGIPFNQNRLTTIGMENFKITKEIDGQKYLFQIIDTAGQERYNSVSDSQIKIADGFLLVFSVESEEFLKKIDKWIKSIEKNAKLEEKVMILAGNKIDIEDRKVTKEYAKNFAEERKMKYFETSAKTKEGIDNCFNQLFQDIYDLYKKLEEEKNNKAKESTNEDNSNQQDQRFELKKTTTKEKSEHKCKC